MSFNITEIVPVEYQDLFKIISPIEKSAILKVIREEIKSENIYEQFYFGLQKYLVKYQNEDISPLVFIMFGQVVQDLEKIEKIEQLLELFPKSPELKLYIIEAETEKGEFQEIETVLSLARLADEERTRIFHRLVSADRLAKVILDLKSFEFEMGYYVQKQDYDKVSKLYSQIEKIWKAVLEWLKKEPIIFIIEQISALILQYANILMSIKDVETAVQFFEREDNQAVFQQCESVFARTSMLYVSANVYYSASQPKKAIEMMEKAINLLPQVFGRKPWKANFYHNYAVMLSLIDIEKCIEAFEQNLELIKDSEDYQSIAQTLSNLINLKIDNNQEDEAKEMLKQLVVILEKSQNLITPFRAYAVVVNAITLEDYKLAQEYLTILKEKVDENPTFKSKGWYAGAKMYYYLDVEINYPEMMKWGNEYLYYVNKEKNYLNITTALFNLCIADFRFYKMTTKKQYLNSSKKRLNELLTFIGKLQQPEYIATKNVILAGYEILVNNYNAANQLLEEIPEISNSEVNENVQIINQLLSFAKEIDETEKRKKEQAEETTEEEKLVKYPQEPLFNKIATNKDMIDVYVTQIINNALQELIAIPTDFKPIKADIKLIILLNNAGLPVYTKIFDRQQINQQLISSFISAINSFANELFGSKEPYFSFERGNNIILFQTISTELNLAIIANKENYDSISKLNAFAKEVHDYLEVNEQALDTTIAEDSAFYKWLEKAIEEIMKL